MWKIWDNLISYIAFYIMINLYKCYKFRWPTFCYFLVKEPWYTDNPVTLIFCIVKGFLKQYLYLQNIKHINMY